MKPPQEQPLSARCNARKHAAILEYDDVVEVGADVGERGVPGGLSVT